VWEHLIKGAKSNQWSFWPLVLKAVCSLFLFAIWSHAYDEGINAIAKDLYLYITLHSASKYPNSRQCYRSGGGTRQCHIHEYDYRPLR
jgi:hypothetical protein